MARAGIRELPIQEEELSKLQHVITSSESKLEHHKDRQSPTPIPCERIAAHPDFVHLSAIEGLVVDLRYASENNFAQRVLYQALDCAWIRREAALGLQQAIVFLREHHPRLRLVLLDALRPQRVQEAIWATLEESPLQAYFADPIPGSIHSFGMAVDVSLIDAQGKMIDMGAGYDQMDAMSHPALESIHIAEGKLMPQHVVHRQWLRDAMSTGGFRGIDTEWWHFDHGDRLIVRRDFPRVL